MSQKLSYIRDFCAIRAFSSSWLKVDSRSVGLYKGLRPSPKASVLIPTESSSSGAISKWLSVRDLVDSRV